MTELSDLPSGPAEIVRHEIERWRQFDEIEEKTLLRLGILRDLIRALHAEKSRLLATGKKNEAHLMKAWEARIEELKNASPLDSELMDFLNGTKKAHIRTRLLPEALFSYIEKEKLSRYDRQWESSIAAEACSIAWRFWSLDARILLTKIEDWNRHFTDQLWPNGLILYVESAEAGGSLPPPNPDIWHGRWIFVLNPRYRTPGDLNLNMKSWPGSPPDFLPKWRLLYTPKKL